MVRRTKLSSDISMKNDGSIIRIHESPSHYWKLYIVSSPCIFSIPPLFEELKELLYISMKVRRAYCSTHRWKPSQFPILFSNWNQGTMIASQSSFKIYSGSSMNRSYSPSNNRGDNNDRYMKAKSPCHTQRSELFWCCW